MPSASFRRHDTIICCRLTPISFRVFRLRAIRRRHAFAEHFEFSPMPPRFRFLPPPLLHYYRHADDYAADELPPVFASRRYCGHFIALLRQLFGAFHHSFQRKRPLRLTRRAPGCFEPFADFAFDRIAAHCCCRRFSPRYFSPISFLLSLVRFSKEYADFIATPAAAD